MASALLVAACGEPDRVGGPEPGPTESRRVVRIEPGERVVFGPGEVAEGDIIRCRGKGGVTVQPPGFGAGSSGGIDAETRLDGSVVATCEPGPPADA